MKIHYFSGEPWEEQTEAIQRILDTTTENIRGFEAGSPTNLVPATYLTV